MTTLKCGHPAGDNLRKDKRCKVCISEGNAAKNEYINVSIKPLRDVNSSSKRIHDIVDIASALSGISSEDLVGVSQLAKVVRVRQACFLICADFGKSTTQIGAKFNRNHATVLHGQRQAITYCRTDSEYASFITKLRKLARIQAFNIDRLSRANVTSPKPEKTPKEPNEPRPKKVRVEVDRFVQKDMEHRESMERGSVMLRDALFEYYEQRTA